jgi:hypothetical protein
VGTRSAQANEWSQKMKSCSEYSAGPGETQAIGVASADFDPSSAGDESALDQLYCNGSDVLDAGRLWFFGESAAPVAARFGVATLTVVGPAQTIEH